MSDYSETPGHPIDEIALQFNASAGSPSEPSVSRDIPPPVHQPGPGDAIAPGLQTSPKTQTAIGPLALAPDRLAAPAFLVDSSLSVRWMARGGKDAFSRAMAKELETAATSNVFEVMVRPAIKEALPDWQAFFTFIYTMLRRSEASAAFDGEASVIPPDQAPPGGEEMNRSIDVQSLGVETCLLAEKGEAEAAPLRIFGLPFEPGTLFLLRRDRWQAPASTAAEEKSPAGVIEVAAEKKTIGVLSLRINDADRLAESMLPEAFFGMVNRIWECWPSPASSSSTIKPRQAGRRQTRSKHVAKRPVGKRSRQYRNILRVPGGRGRQCQTRRRD
jgi:hypothetical protein